jgi:hypothetical protein
MKRKLYFTLLVMPAIAFAQDDPGQMNQQQMQAMMSKMQEMQTCMQQIDQAQMEAIGQRAKKVDAEIKALCAKGERDDAQDLAVEFSEEIKDEPNIKIMRECSKGMEGVMQDMPFGAQPKDLDASHVCDE